jgi:type I restriction enzyme S subunit
VPLRRVLHSIEQGWSPVAEDRTATDGEWAVIKLSAVNKGTFDAYESKAMSAETVPESRFEIKNGDVLLTRANTPDLVGDACLVDSPPPRLMLSDLVYRLRVRYELIHAPFLVYWLLSDPGRTQIQSDARGSSQSMVKVAQGHIRAWRLAVPSLVRQRAIAAFLDRKTSAIDALITKKERLIELLQEKRQALITQAVTKGLDPNVPMRDSGIEWLGEIPAHWGVRRVKNVAQFVTSGSRGWAEFYSESGPLFLRIGNLDAESVSLDLRDVQRVSPPSGAEGKRTRVRTGDVLVSITALIGAVATVRGDLGEAYVNQHLALVRPIESKVVPTWLGYALAGRSGIAQVESGMYGGTKVGLGLDDVRGLWFCLPPVAEQAGIASWLDRQIGSIGKTIRKVQEQTSNVREYRQALISAAVTGKIDVGETTAA